MKQWFSAHKRTAALNLILTFIIMLLSSWIGDAINGSPVFPWLLKAWLLCDPKHPPLWWSIGWPIVFSCLWGGFVVWLYQRRKTFLPVEILRIAEPDHVFPREVLVSAISRTPWQLELVESGALQLQHAISKKKVLLPEKLDDGLIALAALGEREKFAWEQLLRGLNQHKSRLLRVYLIGSMGNNPTTECFDECRSLIRYYFPGLLEEHFILKEASFENLDDLLKVYRTIIAVETDHLSELIIDVTGGTKVVSIAASVVTLEHPTIEFQYVETEGEKRIRTFNIGGGKESSGF